MRSLLAEEEKLEGDDAHLPEGKKRLNTTAKRRQEDEDDHFRSFSVCGFYFFSPQDLVVLCQKLKDKRKTKRERVKFPFVLCCL